jgi:hypothetical protein
MLKTGDAAAEIITILLSDCKADVNVVCKPTLPQGLNAKVQHGMFYLENVGPILPFRASRPSLFY